MACKPVIRLIDDWRDWWRWLSTYIGALYAAVLAFLMVEPSQLLWLFNAMPFQLRLILPVWLQFILAFMLFFGSYMAMRLKAQRLQDQRLQTQSHSDQPADEQELPDAK